ncbi:MAG: AfsR/SARP family transcriptional regulator, partial [Gemmatimonadota bacterium]
EVTDYSRALWHLYSALSRWYDSGVAQRTREQLDAVERFAHGEVGGRLMARVHVVRALLALNEDDAPTASAHLKAAHTLLDPEYSQDYALFHLLRARHALATGEFAQSLAHATLSLQKCEEMQAPAAEIVPILMTMASALAALGRFEESLAAFVRSGEMSDGAQAKPCHLHAHLVRALADVRDGALDEARAEFLAAFALARSIDLTHFFRAVPVLAAEVCGAALDVDADVPFAQRVIAVRRLPCPDAGISRWPWALRLKTFGALVIERDDVPFKPARKAPKRLIDLLRLVVALGGRHVDAARAAALLWPEADGDVGRDALKAMLHRARTLLGADALQVRDGQISFDEDTVCLDTWAFEHVTARIELLAGSSMANGQSSTDGELARRRRQLLTLYRGHFLGDGDVPAWALPMRDRLRARFVRSVELLGRRLEQHGRQDQAIDLYRAALEQDNLAEELYQRLIECHLTRGEQSQALGAYRRCRELLSVVLGLRPSARTEALAARITAR